MYSIWPILVLLYLVAVIHAVKMKAQRLGEDCDIFNWCDEGLSCKDYRCVLQGTATENMVAWAPEGPKCDLSHPCQDPLECIEHRCVYPARSNNTTIVNTTETNFTLLNETNSPNTTG